MFPKQGIYSWRPTILKSTSAHGTLSQDESMLEAFNKGLDIHTATAAKVYGIDDKEVSREQRSHAKMSTLVLFMAFGLRLSQRLGIKRGEAKDIIDSYFSNTLRSKTTWT